MGKEGGWDGKKWIPTTPLSMQKREGIGRTLDLERKGIGGGLVGSR